MVFSYACHDSSWCGTWMKRPFFTPDIWQIQRKLVSFEFLCTKAVTFTTNLKLNGNRLVTQSAVFRASHMGHNNHMTGGGGGAHNWAWGFVVENNAQVQNIFRSKTQYICSVASYFVESHIRCLMPSWNCDTNCDKRNTHFLFLLFLNQSMTAQTNPRNN